MQPRPRRRVLEVRTRIFTMFFVRQTMHRLERQCEDRGSELSRQGRLE